MRGQSVTSGQPPASLRSLARGGVWAQRLCCEQRLVNSWSAILWLQVTVTLSSTHLRSRPIGPCPDQARSAAREAGCAGPAAEHAFPSGRAAILACLALAGIGQ